MKIVVTMVATTGGVKEDDGFHLFSDTSGSDNGLENGH